VVFSDSFDIEIQQRIARRADVDVTPVVNSAIGAGVYYGVPQFCRKNRRSSFGRPSNCTVVVQGKPLGPGWPFRVTVSRLAGVIQDHPEAICSMNINRLIEYYCGCQVLTRIVRYRPPLGGSKRLNLFDL